MQDGKGGSVRRTSSADCLGPGRKREKTDVAVISQLPPPVHGSTLMTRAFLDALDGESISWRLIDRRFSKSVDEVGQFNLGKVVRGLGLVARLGGACVRRRPRVVVLFATTHSFSFIVDWTISELLRAFRIPVILYLHTVGFAALAQRGGCWHQGVRRLLGSAQAVVVLDESLSWDVQDFITIQPDVIRNTLPECPPTTTARIPLSERGIVLFLSNLIPGKGHEDFLSAAANCLDSGLDSRFVLAGAASPSVAAEVNARISRSGWASKITYVGAIGTQEKWDLLSGARMLVFPSTYAGETVGLVLLEAAACGVPIAAYPTGALVPRLAREGAAYVVEAGNWQLLADAIKSILESPELAEHMGSRAVAQFARSFSQSVFSSSWSQILGRFGVPSQASQVSE